jgi:hypothetical protein
MSVSFPAQPFFFNNNVKFVAEHIIVKNSTLNVVYSKILHENDDIFKNGENKKGVETSKLSNDTKKIMSNFRGTIPLKPQKMLIRFL